MLQWSFEVDGQIFSVGVDGRFSSSNVEGIRELCIKGLDLAELSHLDVRQEIAQGRLEEVILKDVNAQQLSV